jgi:predicted P-loop ATPase
VKRINFNHGIDMQQLWAEVKETLYVPGQKNWFLTPDEREMLNESNEIYRTQSSVEDLILQHVNFDSKSTKPVQMTALLRDLGIANPRMPDFKDANRVLAVTTVLNQGEVMARNYMIWIMIRQTEDTPASSLAITKDGMIDISHHVSGIPSADSESLSRASWLLCQLQSG